MPHRLVAGRGSRLFLIVASALLAGCNRDTAPTPPPAGGRTTPGQDCWLSDLTGKAGLVFVHSVGPVDDYFMPHAVGSGCALFDMDGDGRLDIYLLTNAGPESSNRNELYHQQVDGTFRNVSAGSGLDIAGWGMGVICGDVNNDGLNDVLVTEYGGQHLFLNLGGGKFRELPESGGISSTRWGVSAVFLDYDRDGWLDLFVANYVDYDPTWPCYSPTGELEYCAPKNFAPTTSSLYRNLGPLPSSGESPPSEVRFENVSVPAGIADRAGPGMGCHSADFTGDGWPDILVANDGAPNFLWVNQRNGTLREEAVIRGLAVNRTGEPQANMGIATGDVDGNGLFDVVITHLTTETHTLWEQESVGSFEDATPARLHAGVLSRRTGFGTGLIDFDCDGDPDLVIVSGRVLRGLQPVVTELGRHWSPYAEHDQLFANIDGKFADISAANRELCGVPHVGRGLAWGDIDNDGGIDLLLTQVAGPARLFRNVAPSRGHWLLVRAVDPQLKRDALGAQVVVSAGNRRRTGLIQTSGSYASSQDPRAHFGLGAINAVDGISVLWPDGSWEEFPACAADQIVELKRGSGQPGSSPR